MPFSPDLTDPRYLDEVGWFLYHEKYGRNEFGGSYDAERREYSRLLLDSLEALLLKEQFETISSAADEVPHSAWHHSTMRITALKKAQDPTILEKEEILGRYTARLGEHG